MNRFEYVSAKTPEQALDLLKEGGDKVVAKAGGIDLLDRMKEGLSTPARLVSINGSPALRGVKLDGAGLHLGPTTTLAQIAEHPEVRAHHGAIAQAAGSAANPQIRNVATVGGNLLQRPRCWYFRNPEFNCLKKGGNLCFAFKGENRYHAIFGGGPSYIVHPSTMATALAAFGASVRIAAAGKKPRDVLLDKFFTLPDKDETRENVLESGELITDILVPAPPAGTRSAYLVARERQVYDWPLAEVAVVLTLHGTIIDKASVVLGAAAPIPWRATGAEAALTGKRVGIESARAAGAAAVKGAQPLGDNGYKVPLFEALVERAVLAAAEAR